MARRSHSGGSARTAAVALAQRRSHGGARHAIPCPGGTFPVRCSIHLSMSPDRVAAHFQPIVSVRDRSIIGFEGLARVHDESGPVSPSIAFDKANRDGTLLQLDRVCRDRAFDGFAAIRNREHLVLFANLNAALLDGPAAGSWYLSEQVRNAGLEPEHIAIEVVENRVRDLGALRSFCDRYRAAGFLIVVDDFGTSHSNFERLVDVQPDIIKIDRTLIRGIEADRYKRSLVQTIAELARSIGALSLAEGVETVEELQACTVLGADLFQGFLFAKAQKSWSLSDGELACQIDTLSNRAAEHLADTVGKRHDEGISLIQSARELAEQIQSSTDGQINDALMKKLSLDRRIECVFVLDLDGRQRSDTVVSEHTVVRHPNLFHPARRGTDHSLKDYVYNIRTLGAPTVTTRPYLSRATGNLCRTVSIHTFTAAGEPVILCLDFKAEQGGV